MTPGQIDDGVWNTQDGITQHHWELAVNLKLLPEFQTVLNSVFLQLAPDSTCAQQPSEVPAGEGVCRLPTPLGTCLCCVWLELCAAFWGHYSLDGRLTALNPLSPTLAQPMPNHRDPQA